MEIGGDRHADCRMRRVMVDNEARIDQSIVTVEEMGYYK
jgi:hypothetical protein